MHFLSINVVISIAFFELLTSWTFAHPTFTTSSPSHQAASSISQRLGRSPHGQPTSNPSFISTSHPSALNNDSTITLSLFHSLEELARLVDISYCVGTSGITKPFQCASRCDDFPGFELVDTFNTGVAKSDSSGYIVLDHGLQNDERDHKKGRIIVAFRGTYSIANTIADLSTVPQEYVPYPEDPEKLDDPDTSIEDTKVHTVQHAIHRLSRYWPFKWRHTSGSATSEQRGKTKNKCTNCTVHTGFYTSWVNTRPYVVPHLNALKEQYPGYQLHLVGHSLGGAVAALAALELEGDGWSPIITTFGEPMIGNQGLGDFIDGAFELNSEIYGGMNRRYRRVTHVGDPVPLLPLKEWGYRSHAGEIYIGKGDLQPQVQDVHLCYDDEDTNCITGSGYDNLWLQGESLSTMIPVDFLDEIRAGKWGVDDAQQATEEGKGEGGVEKRWPKLPISTRYKFWQLFFAHRDYFWRLGLCLPGGDPLDWRRPHYNLTGMVDGKGKEEL